jgi:hypothetical protein
MEASNPELHRSKNGQPFQPIESEQSEDANVRATGKGFSIAGAVSARRRSP